MRQIGDVTQLCLSDRGRYTAQRAQGMRPTTERDLGGSMLVENGLSEIEICRRECPPARVCHLAMLKPLWIPRLKHDSSMVVCIALKFPQQAKEGLSCFWSYLVPIGCNQASSACGFVHVMQKSCRYMDHNHLESRQLGRYKAWYIPFLFIQPRYQ